MHVTESGGGASVSYTDGRLPHASGQTPDNSLSDAVDAVALPDGFLFTRNISAGIGLLTCAIMTICLSHALSVSFFPDYYCM